VRAVVGISVVELGVVGDIVVGIAGVAGGTFWPGMSCAVIAACVVVFVACAVAVAVVAAAVVVAVVVVAVVVALGGVFVG
jgi:hypothetical protein